MSETAQAVNSPLQSRLSALMRRSSPNFKQQTPVQPQIDLAQPKQDPNCPCNTYVLENDPKCRACNGLLKPFEVLFNENISNKNLLEISNQKLAARSVQYHELINENRTLKEKNELLESDLKNKILELKSTQRDLQVMGEKLVDEIEKRAELQHSTETVQEEIATLTEKLFEEANKKVSDQARKAHGHAEREKTLEGELLSLRSQYNDDLAQLKELKSKLTKISSASQNINSPSRRNLEKKFSDNGGFYQYDEIDPFVIQQFKDFYFAATTEKKISNLVKFQFLKSSLEEDFDPCLRIQNCSSKFQKKLLESIQNNTCFIEEISSTKLNQKKKVNGTTSSNDNIPISDDLYSSANKGGGVAFSFNFGNLTNSNSNLSLSANPLLPSCSCCQKIIEEPKYHLKFTEFNPNYFPICPSCRLRLINCCEFYGLIRNLQNGLFKNYILEDVWWEFCLLKLKMFWSRVGSNFTPPPLNFKPNFDGNFLEKQQSNINSENTENPYSAQEERRPTLEFPVLGEEPGLESKEEGGSGITLPKEIKVKENQALEESGDLADINYEAFGGSALESNEILGTSTWKRKDENTSVNNLKKKLDEVKRISLDLPKDEFQRTFEESLNKTE
ncbi:hypothetical protein HDU92_002791 [Lobulomyces angularis]|nr:hypothetical protein HDU92_002791 [Lobulomyces angularis]